MTPAADDTGEDEGSGKKERPVPTGPTGRPLSPPGALFEAAFKRFGARIGSYLLYTVICGLPALLVLIAGNQANLDGYTTLVAFLIAYTLGHMALVGILAGLMVGRVRERAGQIAIAVVIASAPLIVAATLLPPVAVVLYPFVVFGPIAAAAADADGLGAIVYGVRIAGRWLTRCYVVLVGLGLVAAGAWFGFVIAATPIGSAQQEVAGVLATLLVWPIAALVERNLYGDLTGRLVIRAAPGAPERETELQERRPNLRRKNRRRPSSESE